MSLQGDLWRRQWQPTPVFLPGEFHGQKSWRATVRDVAESDMTERLTHTRGDLSYEECRARAAVCRQREGKGVRFSS